MKVKVDKLFNGRKGVCNATFEIEIENKDEFIRKIKSSYRRLVRTQKANEKITETSSAITFHREHLVGNAISTTYTFPF